MSARALNIIAGIWLFISAFIWPHTQAQMTNTWIIGVLVVIFGLLATSAPSLRFVNTILSIWLFISAFALPSERVGTVWNNALVAVAIFIISLAGTRPETLGRRAPMQPV